MPKIAIVVEFHAKPGMLAAFEAHIRDHAAQTLATEPGCERFDVLRPLTADGEPDGTRVMLYELYTDQAAFDAHRTGARLPGVAERSAPLLDNRVLTICHTA